MPTHGFNALSFRARVWLGLNVAGVALFLHNAANLWPVPGDEHNPGGPGDAFYWVLAVAPLLASFLLVNLTVLVHVARTRVRARLSACLPGFSSPLHGAAATHTIFTDHAK